MARRASKSSSSPLTIILIVGIAALVGVIVFMAGGDNKKESSITSLPIDDYMARASQLRGNTYSMDGKVEERFPRTDGELISVIVKTGPGQQVRLPVIVPTKAKSVNIEREQEYTFRVKVETLHDQKGMLLAESVSPIH